MIEMTGREIGERFIRAVQIIEGLYHVGPGNTRGAWVAVPYTQADKNGWGSERLADERRAFWNSINRAPRPWEITEAEETQGWLSLVPNKDERSALISWARCMALGAIFKDWCKQQGIHPETGRRRKERAILRILLAFSRKPLQHNENDLFSLLPDTPEISDKSVNIAEDAPTSWMAENAKPMACDFDSELQDFSWAQKRNEIRRQREARKREAA